VLIVTLERQLLMLVGVAVAGGDISWPISEGANETDQRSPESRDQQQPSDCITEEQLKASQILGVMTDSKIQEEETNLFKRLK
jgi:hypothetical protein